MRSVHLVCFRIGKETYGVDIAGLREIVRPQEMTSIPGTARYVLGIINLRGKIIPVVDLADRLGLPKSDWDKSSRILVATVDGSTVGFLVDEATEVMKLSGEAVEPPPEDILDARLADYLLGVGRVDGRLVILLDLRKVLAEKALSAAATAAQGGWEAAQNEPVAVT